VIPAPVSEELMQAARGYSTFVIANNKARGCLPLTPFKLATLMAPEASRRHAAHGTSDLQRW
jgi:hypothetical protein